MTQGRDELIHIRRTVALVGRFSDGLLRIGPFRFGAEAALSWIPGVGEAYGGAAAVFLLVQGLRARIPMSTLVGCAALMFGRTLFSAVPIVGPLAADALALHGLSARLIVQAIDRRIAGDDQPIGARRRSWRGRRPVEITA